MHQITYIYTYRNQNNTRQPTVAAAARWAGLAGPGAAAATTAVHYV